MDDTGEDRPGSKMLTIYFACLSLAVVTGDIIVQDDANCGSLRYPTEKALGDRNEEIIASHSGDFYQPGKDCVVSIVGRTGYQFQVTLEFLQVDKKAMLDPVSQEPLRCHDYVKLYDSPRVDNAKILTSTTGLCGNRGTLPKVRTFVTNCPYLSIEFVTDPEFDAYRGFNLRIIQYKWRNPGNIYPGAGLVPGATQSCYWSEFQPGWDNQADSWPGSIGQGGSGSVIDGDRDGIHCYRCNNCPVDNFEPANYPSSSAGGCYRCSKQFDITRGDAERRCYSQNDYLEVIQSFQDPDLDSTGYLGCRTFVDEYNTVTKYCFCNSEYCNTATSARPLSLFFLLLTSCTGILFQSIH